MLCYVLFCFSIFQLGTSCLFDSLDGSSLAESMCWFVCVLLTDSASSVVLGGKAFIDQFESKEKKHNERFYSFITNSSRLYSFIDDMLDDSAMDLMDMDLDLGGIDIMDGACLESALMQPVPDTVLVEVEDLNAGWHSAHGDAAESAPQGLDDSAHSLLGDASFSLGPVSITDVRRAQVSTCHLLCVGLFC